MKEYRIYFLLIKIWILDSLVPKMIHIRQHNMAWYSDHPSMIMSPLNHPISHYVWHFNIYKIMFSLLH